MKRTPKTRIDENMRQWCRCAMQSALHADIRKLGQDQFNQKLLAWLEGDAPLSREARSLIAYELRSWYSSPSYIPQGPPPEREREFQIVQAAKLKDMLQECGMTATEAEQDVAEDLGISVDALRKRFQRELGPALKRLPVKAGAPVINGTEHEVADKLGISVASLRRQLRWQRNRTVDD